MCCWDGFSKMCVCAQLQMMQMPTTILQRLNMVHLKAQGLFSPCGPFVVPCISSSCHNHYRLGILLPTDYMHENTYGFTVQICELNISIAITLSIYIFPRNQISSLLPCDALCISQKPEPKSSTASDSCKVVSTGMSCWYLVTGCPNL